MTQQDSTTDGRIVEGVHVLPVRIYYEDTDFSGLVYHGSYVRFFERGRTELLRACGLHHAALADGSHGQPIVFAVRDMVIRFVKPARIDDLLEVRTRLSEARGARLVLEQEIWRDGSLLVSAQVVVAVILASGRPVRLPPELAARLPVQPD
ncbi:tol-pal system-associated acyl-CoA thioesterase [Pannonibacter sp. Q-1]|uniref:tol-pal system-associated acyl-CoA thioesterase n=1 Tax=unclassified Pannonibacter TaxID=2627228 RepID=UPI001648E0BA|nr:MULTISPECIES: tol-pal system-associated acyl-CoA thioesterase [unclassified Pannonibacter]